MNNNPTALSASSFSLVLPPSSAINEFWPEIQQFVALPHDLQRAMPSHHGAIHVGFCLLLAVIDTIQAKGKTPVNLASMEHHLPWIIDNINALWRHFRRWTISSGWPTIYDEITLVYIQLLDSFVMPSVTSESRSPFSFKIAMTLINSLAELLDNLSTSSPAEAVQIRVASIFTRLRSFLSSQPSDTSIQQRRQDASRHMIQNELEESIIKTFQDAEHFTKLHKDLQVCHCHKVACSN